MSGQGAAQKARNMWRSLTSMGTALVLLFLLALAAIPGALLPQRGLNAAKVDDYLAAHPLIGPWLDELQAFDVFSSCPCSVPRRPPRPSPPGMTLRWRQTRI